MDSGDIEAKVTDIGKALRRAGDLYVELGRQPMARYMYETAFREYQAVFGDEHKATKETRQVLNIFLLDQLGPPPEQTPEPEPSLGDIFTRTFQTALIEAKERKSS